MFEFLTILINYFADSNIQYMLSGSVAMSTYVVPRATRDIDIVIHLKPDDIEGFADYFKEGYYCDEESIREAVRTRGMFNIIDHQSGFKAYFVILKHEAFRLKEFERRREADFFGSKIFIVSPEDLLISKLIWIQELRSSQQMEDIKSLSFIESLDWHYINYWIGFLKLNTLGLIK